MSDSLPLRFKIQLLVCLPGAELNVTHIERVVGPKNIQVTGVRLKTCTIIHSIAAYLWADCSRAITGLIRHWSALHLWDVSIASSKPICLKLMEKLRRMLRSYIRHLHIWALATALAQV